MPRFWLQADISLLKVLPGFRIPAGGMNDIERLSEAHVEMKPDRSRAVVDRDHSHVDVRRIGAQIEVAQAVESGRRVVEVCVDVAVKHEAKVGAPLREGRLRRSRRRRRRGGLLSERQCCREKTRQAYAKKDRAFHFVLFWGMMSRVAIRGLGSV